MSEVSDLIEETFPRYIKRKKDKKAGKVNSVPEGEHKLVYDSSTETLEPIYFFIIDLIEGFGFKMDKVSDSFSSSPGSGHFGELGSRSTMMQQQATKIMGDINIIVKSALSLLYDLKEFRTRLESYDGLHSKDEEIKSAARLALKQVWMDKVDIQKGNSALKAMALGQAGFVTLLDAFLAAGTVKDVKKLDLNDRVKRILTPRLKEFDSWVVNSEEELRKRYQIERSYLKSQVNSLKLYSRWAKPYLLAARDLTQKDRRKDPNLVSTFNTIMLNLTLFCKRGYDPKGDAASGDLPELFLKENVQKKLRGHSTCVLVDFNFRGIPQRVSQGQSSHYAFGGKAEISFKSYALNEEEIKKLEQLIDEKDLEDSLGLIEGVTTDSLKAMQEEIEEFLDEEKKEEKKKESSDESNPIMALLGFYNNKKEKKKDNKKDEKIDKIKKDTYNEKMVRERVSLDAEETAFSLFDIYKKAHGMASFS